MKNFPLDNQYRVDTEGNVYSVKSGKLYRLRYQRDISGNYYRVAISNVHYLVHRVVAITYLPLVGSFKDFEVNHKDGDKLNNALDNLEWVTKGENQEHAYRTGLKTIPIGVDNANHKLEDSEVLDIYKKLLEGSDKKSLADLYNVTSTTIGRIANKNAWSHITKLLPDLTTRFKSKTLEDYQLEDIKYCIKLGKTFKETLEIVNFHFTRDQFYRIKRFL
jgi:hypothetical protein